MNNLVRRKIDFTFRLGTGEFGETGFNTVTLSGLRARVDISKVGAPSMGQANCRIYGLTPSMLNDFSALNAAYMMQRRNIVSITAGDDVNGMTLIFEGQINVGQIDMQNSPDSMLEMVALAGLLDAIMTAAPLSFPGPTDVAVIMATLANTMGYDFENNGVSVILSNPYLPGSPRDQAMRAANAANINWIIDNGVLAIWPRNGSRHGTLPVISPAAGMAGYPSYSNLGIAVKTEFNPYFNIGQTVKVESSLKFATGQWNVFNLEHELESETPGGDWFTRFDGSPFNANPQ